jgi:hypothetical protein
MAAFIIMLITILAAAPCYAESVDKSGKIPLFKASKQARADVRDFRTARADAEREINCLRGVVDRVSAKKREETRAGCLIGLSDSLDKMEGALKRVAQDFDRIKEHMGAIRDKDVTAKIRENLDRLQSDLGSLQRKGDILGGIANLAPDALDPRHAEALSQHLSQEEALAGLIPKFQEKLTQVETARDVITGQVDRLDWLARTVELRISEISLARALVGVTMDIDKVRLSLCYTQDDAVCDAQSSTALMQSMLKDNTLDQLNDALGFNGTPKHGKSDAGNLKNQLRERRKS